MISAVPNWIPDHVEVSLFTGWFQETFSLVAVLQRLTTWKLKHLKASTLSSASSCLLLRFDHIPQTNFHAAISLIICTNIKIRV